jgi:hypothetical protein
VTEIKPDAFGLSTSFDAEHSLVGNVAGICRQLALRVETWKTRRRKKAAVTESMRKSGLALHFATGMNHRANFDYMTFKNPSAKLLTTTTNQLVAAVPHTDDFNKDAAKLWENFHEGCES